MNVPEGDVASGALERLGGELRLKQFEMVLARYRARFRTRPPCEAHCAVPATSRGPTRLVLLG